MKKENKFTVDRRPFEQFSQRASLFQKCIRVRSRQKHGLFKTNNDFLIEAPPVFLRLAFQLLVYVVWNIFYCQGRHHPPPKSRFQIGTILAKGHGSVKHRDGRRRIAAAFSETKDPHFWVAISHSERNVRALRKISPGVYLESAEGVEMTIRITFALCTLELRFGEDLFYPFDNLRRLGDCSNHLFLQLLAA